MKPPIKQTRPGDRTVNPKTFAPPTPRVSRQTRGKVLTAAEKAAFLASRPDLKKSD